MSEEEILKWKKRFERERNARKQAEQLLEQKSAELYEVNQSLQEKIEEELEKNRNKELMLLQQSKMASIGEMIGNIAHQWRQPLSAISSQASSHILLDEMGALTKEQSVKMLEEIVEHTQFLSNTIDDFRNFFRQDKEYTHFDVRSTVERCEKIVSGVMHSRSITFLKDIEDIELFSLKNEFIQVVLNLIKNAIDAMEDVFDDDDKFILVRGYLKDGNAVIEVRDSADGVPESIIQKVFEPYFTTKHQAQGTGIGLFMSIEIIQKHMHGTMSVENKMTQFTEHQELYGACFTIKIPLEY
jgi:signal transduction histidine kinase